MSVVRDTSRASEVEWLLQDNTSRESPTAFAGLTSNDASQVQFSCGIFFGDKVDGEARLDIIRVGAIEHVSVVKYETVSASAKAGANFIPVSDYVFFDTGDHCQSISVPLVKNDLWTATKEFKVVLSSPQNCVVSDNMHTCRVKVVDHNAFPSNSFREALEQRGVQEISGASLYWGYFRWNFLTSGLATATVLTLIFDQLSNFYHLAIVLVDMYLVNMILNDKVPEEDLFVPDREQMVYFVVAIHVLPWGVMLLWEWVRQRLNIKGRTMEHLRKEMYRKYMNLAPDVLDEVGPEHLEFGLLTECVVVATGYEGVLLFIKMFVNVLMNIYLVARKRSEALPFVCTVIVVVILWGTFREQYLIPPVKKETTRVTHLVKEAAYKHELICQFHVRPHMNEAFEEAVRQLRLQEEVQMSHLFRTHVLLAVLSPMVVGAYMVLRVRSVLYGDLDLGTFLGIIKIINTVAAESCGAYKEFGGVVHTFAMLRNIIEFLNRPTDVTRLRDHNRNRRSQSAELLAYMKRPDFDDLPLYCKDLGVAFGPCILLKDITVKIPQGRLVAIYGPLGSGKNMLLRLLAHMTHRSCGDLYIPSHLRVLIVSREPMFLWGGLLKNLFLGKPAPDRAELQRARRILEDLGLLTLAQEVHPEEPVDLAAGDPAWAKRLNAAQRHAASLARALVAHPEVMLLQRPLQSFNAKGGKAVFRLLRGHVDQKGLYTSPATAHLRRPCSVLYTCEENQVKGADLTYEVATTGRRNTAGGEVFTLRVGR